MNDIRPICINEGCGKPATFSRTEKDGRKRWRVHCAHCQGASYGKHPHRPGVKPFKTGICSNQDGRLGFSCSVDYNAHPHAIGVTEVDHIDGNHCNNDINNLQELCPVCHSLKSKIHGNNRGYRYSTPSTPANVIMQSLFDLDD